MLLPKLRQKWQNLGHSLLQGMAKSVPKACLLCQQPHQQKYALCQYCYLEYCQPWAHCLSCDKPISKNALLCAACCQPKHIVISACHYHSPLGQQIPSFKSGWQLALQPVLCQLLQQRIRLFKQAFPQIKINSLVPIPSHIYKLKARGFNPAWVIANDLSNRLSTPLVDDKLFKIKPTQDQAGLDNKQRQRNLLGSFHCRHNLADANIALVDDVYTTGATINEAAKALGLKQAIVCCWARAKR
ncbi:ComF family protein [Paraferrimonas sp. SM1919]|uniref:ComF family protein n=1 Tax=Paraferrimonas sp. SM1919 TaxID=2662263 RepID=UPI0013D1B167|nr:ComF family protein [Paraferrimonas sp. SM1919]